MNSPKAKSGISPLASMATRNLDRAASEIEGTIGALKDVTSQRGVAARAMLIKASRLIFDARDLVIETFTHDIK